MRAFEYNMGAMQLGPNAEIKSNSKYIDIRRHVLGELVAKANSRHARKARVPAC